MSFVDQTPVHKPGVWRTVSLFCTHTFFVHVIYIPLSQSIDNLCSECTLPCPT